MKIRNKPTTKVHYLPSSIQAEAISARPYGVTLWVDIIPRIIETTSHAIETKLRADIYRGTFVNVSLSGDEPE